jgi:hypothetical protein
MNYDPDDRKVTLRQVLAGWTLCLGMVGLVFAATGRHHAIPSVNASNLLYATDAACCSIGSARLPDFTSYVANKSRQRPGRVIARDPVELKTSVDQCEARGANMC